VGRRQGVEFSAETTLSRWTFAASFSYVAATFQSPFTVYSPDNSSADATGEIQVSPGDRIPGIPASTLKLRVQYVPTERATIGVSLVAVSSQYSRGDENNQDGNGPVPGYAIVNLDAQWEVARVAGVRERGESPQQALCDLRRARRELLHRSG